MKLSDFDYNLPKELIAQYPCEKRDESCLLVLNRKNGEIEYRQFRDIVDYITPKDALVLNDTKVFPARLIGRTKSGAKVEVLLLRDADCRGYKETWMAADKKNTEVHKVSDSMWYALTRPSSKLKQGARIEFADGRLSCEVVEADNQKKLLRFCENGKLKELIEEIGYVPLPPYIKRPAEDMDKTRYQTVYAKTLGAVAAPTAGLHWTREVIGKLESKGVKIVYVTLHVGYGTFKPVREDDITNHEMDEEYFEISEESAKALNEVKSAGGKIFAVGTTACRVLESCAERVTGYGLRVTKKSGYTNLFIYPGYEFKFTDCLLTNFHLPKTTLLMLVSAFAGFDLILRAYKEAIERRYRFYSYGDAMLVL